MSNNSEHITRRVEAVYSILENANIEWDKVDKFELRWEKIDIAAGEHFEDWQLVPVINIENKK